MALGLFMLSSLSIASLITIVIDMNNHIETEINKHVEIEKVYETEINDLKQQQTKWNQEMKERDAQCQLKYNEGIKKSKDKVDNMQHVLSQIDELEVLYKNLGDKYKTIRKKIEIYNDEIQQINSEYQHIHKYHPDQLSMTSDEYIYSVVLLGETGHHKSTFGNRLSGDISPYGESSEFTTSTASSSCTKGFTKRIIKNLYPKMISVVDTPGFNDTDNDDRINAENLVSYLRGSGGINAFVWITKETKFTKNYANSLQILQDLIGKEFWKHMIFVRSMVNNDTPAMRDKDIYSTKLRDSIGSRFELDDTYKLPIIALDTYYYYKKPIIEEFIGAIPQNKFNCDKIVSPMSKWKENAMKKRNILYNSELAEFKKIKNEFNLLCHKANDSLNMKSLDEVSYDIHIRKLSQITDNAKQYDISSIDEELKEIIDFSDKQSSEIDVKMIDFSDKSYVKSVLPIITELSETEIDDIIKECNIRINRMEKYGKRLSDNYPYSMITKHRICMLINNNGCKPCINQVNNETNHKEQRIIDDIILDLEDAHHQNSKRMSWPWNDIDWKLLLLITAIIYIINNMRKRQTTHPNTVQPINEGTAYLWH